MPENKQMPNAPVSDFLEVLVDTFIRFSKESLEVDLAMDQETLLTFQVYREGDVLVAQFVDQAGNVHHQATTDGGILYAIVAMELKLRGVIR